MTGNCVRDQGIQLQESISKMTKVRFFIFFITTRGALAYVLKKDVWLLSGSFPVKEV